MAVDVALARKLTYRFLELPHVVRLQISVDLGLYTPDDRGLNDHDLYTLILKRAKERGLLPDLLAKCEEWHANA